MSILTGTQPTTGADRSRAREVATALEDAGLVDPGQHDEAMAVISPLVGPDETAATSFAPLRRRLGEVATYIGVAFVLAGVAVFIAPRWLDLTWTTRVAMLAGTGLVLATAGWAAARPVGGFVALRHDARAARLRLVSVLLTSAAVAGAAAAGVAMLQRIEAAGTEMTEGTRIGLAASATLVLLAAVGYALAPSLVGHAAIAVGVAYVVPFTVEELGTMEPRPIGLGFLLAGGGWVALAERGIWREVVAGRLVGVAFLLVGSQLQLTSEPVWAGYVLTFAAGVLGFLLYLSRRAWPYLVLGVVGVTLAVPEALIDWTEGTLGTAIALLGAGLALLLSGLFALTIRRDPTT